MGMITPPSCPRLSGRLRRGILPALALLAFSAPAVVTRADDPTPPKVGYWHVWTDDKGVSHQTREQLGAFELKSIEPPASPQWLDKLKAEGATIVVTVQPVGWRGEWHENPHPQWIIPLSGRWFVETMDGQRVEMGPGEISFGEDQNTHPDPRGHKGHLSGTVGDVPSILMIVQLADQPTVNQPARWK